jgi:hypothetical protein
MTFKKNKIKVNKINKIQNQDLDKDLDSQFSDDTRKSNNSQKSIYSNTSNNSNNLNNIIQRTETLLNNSTFENKILNNNNNNNNNNNTQNNKNNTFLEQFDNLSYNNNKPISSNVYANINKLDQERSFSEFNPNKDMTYNILPKKYTDNHNNMIPFFKRGIGKGLSNELIDSSYNSNSQRTLDLYSGSSKSINYTPRTERRPLFNPQVGNSNIYGSPNFTDFYESRVIPSRFKNNEKLHQEIRVTPGLNLGYTEVSKQGFHDDFRPLPKTVDDLRVATNPKTSYEPSIIAGLKGTKRAIIPNVESRKPPTFYETDPRDFIKSISYNKAPTVYGNVDLPITNRQLNDNCGERPGPAGLTNSSYKPESLIEQFESSFKENFDSRPIAPPGSAITQQSYIIDQNNINPDATMRDLTSNNTYLNGPNFNNQSYVRDANYVQDPNMRNLIENVSFLNPANLNTQGYTRDLKDTRDLNMRNLNENVTYLAAPNLNNQGYARDINDTQDLNMRNLNENVTYLPGPTLNNQGYARDINDTRDLNMRNLTENVTYLQAPTLNNQGYARDINDTRDLNMRNLTENVTYIAAPTLNNQGYARDLNDTRDANMRNLTENVTYLPGPTLNNQGYARDLKDVRDANMRNLHENNTYLTGPKLNNQSYTRDLKDVRDLNMRNLQENVTYLTGPSQNSQSYVRDQNYIQDPTLRNLTEVNTYINPATQNSQSYVRDQNYIQDPTLRNLTEVNTYLNPANLNSQSYIRDPNYVQDLTLRNLTEVNTYLAPANLQQGGNTRSRNDVENMSVNISKEKLITIRDGGRPVTSNYNKGPVTDFSLVELVDPIQINRDFFGDSSKSGTLIRTPTFYTREANVLPQVESQRINQYPSTNLLGNPYVNNTQHKSVVTYY